MTTTKPKIWVVTVDRAGTATWVLGSCSSEQGALDLAIAEHRRMERMALLQSTVLVVTPTTLDGTAGPGGERFLYVPTKDDPEEGSFYDYDRSKLVAVLSAFG